MPWSSQTSQIQVVVNGIATLFVTARLAVQAAMLALVQTKSSQYKDRLIVLANRQNAAPALLRRLVGTACQRLVAVVMVLLACRPLASTILVHGKQENPFLDRQGHIYNEMHNLVARMTDFTRDPDATASANELYVSNSTSMSVSSLVVMLTCYSLRLMAMKRLMKTSTECRTCYQSSRSCVATPLKSCSSRLCPPRMSSMLRLIDIGLH